MLATAFAKAATSAMQMTTARAYGAAQAARACFSQV
jgi:hypothetical protein